MITSEDWENEAAKWRRLAEESVVIIGHLSEAARIVHEKNVDLEKSLKKVQAIAKQSVDRLPAKWNDGYAVGKKDALKSWKEGWRHARKCEQQMKDENAAFTAEIMNLESQLEAWKKVFGHLGATPDEIGNLLNARTDELTRFVIDCGNNWDCDSDAHKYGCRKCDARKLMKG